MLLHTACGFSLSVICLCLLPNVAPKLAYRMADGVPPWQIKRARSPKGLCPVWTCPGDTPASQRSAWPLPGPGSPAGCVRVRGLGWERQEARGSAPSCCLRAQLWSCCLRTVWTSPWGSASVAFALDSWLHREMLAFFFLFARTGMIQLFRGICSLQPRSISSLHAWL